MGKINDTSIKGVTEGPVRAMLGALSPSSLLETPIDLRDQELRTATLPVFMRIQTFFSGILEEQRRQGVTCS